MNQHSENKDKAIWGISSRTTISEPNEEQRQLGVVSIQHSAGYTLEVTINGETYACPHLLLKAISHDFTWTDDISKAFHALALENKNS